MGTSRQHRLTDADVYAEWVRETHRHPHFLTEEKVFEWLNVEWVSMDRRFGAWAMTMVTFKDGSTFNLEGPNIGVDNTLLGVGI